VFAQAGDDEVYGGQGDDVIAAGDGDDVVKAGNGDDLVQGGIGDDLVRAGRGADKVFAQAGNDRVYGGHGDDEIAAGGGDDTVVAANGHDIVSGGGGNDSIDVGSGRDVVSGDLGDDMIWGQRGHDTLDGGGGHDWINGGFGRDRLFGGDGRDQLFGRAGDDFLEGGRHDDELYGNGGDDHLLAMSWGGEPAIAQDPRARKVEPQEPISDDDILAGGRGADLFEFRWLIDARPEILAKHTDASGDIDYSMNGVAGENNAVHDHWVETTGNKTVLDFKVNDGDRFVFKGHTLALDAYSSGLRDADGDGGVDDTVLYFYSDQGAAGAHNRDRVGTVTFLDATLDLDEVAEAIDANVYYGVADPYSAAG
jgi:Ca2+-binding RTX toxin-like protein